MNVGLYVIQCSNNERKGFSAFLVQKYTILKYITQVSLFVIITTELFHRKDAHSPEATTKIV